MARVRSGSLMGGLMTYDADLQPPGNQVHGAWITNTSTDRACWLQLNLVDATIWRVDRVEPGTTDQYYPAPRPFSADEITVYYFGSYPPGE